MMARAALCSLACLAVALAGCASSRVDPHTASVVEHESEAAREDRIAREHMAEYDPYATELQKHCGGSPTSSYATTPCWSEMLNPTQKHFDEAMEHARRAERHRAAAAALRAAEAKACAGVAMADRDISPFHHFADIVRVTIVGAPDAPEGADVVFKKAPGLTVESMQRIVDCHLARNAALGHEVPEMPYCPLVPKNVAAVAAEVPDGIVVRLRGTDAEAGKAIAARAKTLAPSK